jgi:DNA primase
MSYLTERGVALDAIQTFGIGYYDLSNYSEFYDRMMFPIRSQYGDVLAFQGRAMGGQEPKYKHNTGDWKSKVVYGLYENGQRIVAQDFVVVVEGPFDVIALWQGGIPAVALLGTAVHLEQLLQIRRYTREVKVWTDNDSAGMKARENLKKLAVKADLHLTDVHSSGYYKDAGDMMEKRDYSAMKELIYGV